MFVDIVQIVMLHKKKIGLVFCPFINNAKRIRRMLIIFRKFSKFNDAAWPFSQVRINMYIRQSPAL